MAPFPPTERSVIAAAQSDHPDRRRQAFDVIVSAYWKPVYKYIRIRGRASAEDTRDLTQEFFTRAFEKSFFDPYDPERSRFRTFLRVCLDRFLSNQFKAAGRLKRGGHHELLSLDFEGAEGELHRQPPAEHADPEEFFYREWVRQLFSLIVEDLRRHCESSGKQVHFLLFEQYDLEAGTLPDKPTYEDIGRAHGLTAGQVTNYLAWARREFRRLVLEKLQELSGSDADFRLEARQLLGITPR